MRNKKIIIIPVVFIIFGSLWLILRSETVGPENIKAPVVRGDFKITVYTSGELETKNSENIMGPSGLRTVGIWNVQISELIPEGTMVKEGDWVATMDRAEISNRLQDRETELERLQSTFIQTRLDTTMELRNARNDLINLEYALEEARIAYEQSSFEPPAAIRQAEINMDKAQRAYDQALHNYQLRLEQADAKMREVTASLNQVQRRLDNLLEVLEDFEIFAPKDGMVIYRRQWDGSKITVGSQISPWENIVATLPDFSVMMSRTYVNEVDISKVAINQKAEIVVDAFPDKRFTGFVQEVANIGEQRPNQDARVFEVKIQINESDTIMRPAMTTKNTIITHIEEDVLFVPLEAIHVFDDITYVFKDHQNRIIRQQVRTGLRNDNQIIIREGLEEGEMVYLNIPGDPEEFRLATL
ncbi:MAG: HlyD family efflux transporter periplasmic adaptor subunit [Bacteroidetes bacterium]|nr:MAG: HlyD family efflux transporter periplasmic adaptor subunit [Bacteroidota bacterium]